MFALRKCFYIFVVLFFLGPGFSRAAEDSYEFQGGDSFKSALEVPSVGSFAAPFNLFADSDWFWFESFPGRQYVVETKNLGISADTILSLYVLDPEGNLLLKFTNDDRYDYTKCQREGGTDCFASRIIFNTSESRKYYFKVEGYNYGPGTEYDVTVQTAIAAYVAGEADVFRPNPIVSSRNLFLVDNNDQDSSELGAQLYNVLLPEVWDDGGRFRLVGPYVSTALTSKSTLESSPSFRYTRSQQAFEEANAFFHIDRAQRYLQSLGFSGLFDQPILVDAHGTTEDNSWFMPLDMQLYFGVGGVDDAEDAEVVLHEYGHAILHYQSAMGELSSGGDYDAIHEGFGDYFAAAVCSTLGNGFQDALVGEWDATSYTTGPPPSYLRRLDYSAAQRHYPEAVQNDPHADGEIWSSALWEIRQALGGERADRTVLQANYFLNPTSTFLDAAESLLLSNELLYGGVNSDVISQILDSRGLLDNADPDADGVPAWQDNCADMPNPGQADADADGAGDACDGGDSDGDGIADMLEVLSGSNPAASDSDGDGVPDGLDLRPTSFDLTPLSDDTLFVEQLYLDLFARTVDPGGSAYWVQSLESGALTRSQLVERLLLSDEFQEISAPVIRLYFACFSRIPDYAGLSYWIDLAAQGVGLEVISEAFTASEEFHVTYGADDNGAYVERVYQNVLGRSPDLAGLAYWTGLLDSGALTRSQMMIVFSENDGYRMRMANEVTVTSAYFGLLLRSPDAGGFNFWVGELGEGRGGEELLTLFMAGEEYLRRFLY